MTPPTVQFIPAGGLSLTIHDAFSGSGSIAGRTPDTADNGNTWQIPEATAGFTVGSGYVYRSSTDGWVYHDNAVIDIGTSGPFRVEALVNTMAMSGGVGITAWNNDGSTGTYPEENITHKIGYAANQHRLQKVDAGTETNFHTAGGLLSSYTDYLMVLECDGSSFDCYLYDSTGTTLIDSGSGTPSGLTPTNYVGVHFGGTTLGSTRERVYDFKVYT